MANIFNEDFRDFIKAFNQCEVDYLLVGGMAVILHGYVRTTGDMDVWVMKSSENYFRIIHAFQIFGMPVFEMTPENFPDDQIDVWSFGRDPSRIDLMTELKGVIFDEALQLAQTYTEESVPFRYLHISNLFQAKIASGRYKDLADLEQLAKLHKQDLQ